MTITAENLNEYIIISLEGRVDTNNYNDFETRMQEIIPTGAEKIILDCSGLHYMSSSGLRVFVMMQKKITLMKGVLKLCNLQEVIQEIFDISGLSMIFSIYPDRNAALKQ